MSVADTDVDIKEKKQQTRHIAGVFEDALRRMTILKRQFLRAARRKIYGRVKEVTNKTLDESWERIEFNVEGVTPEIPCIYKPSEDPQALVVFCTGLKASVATYKKIIEGLNDRGIAVITVNLPFPEYFKEDDCFYEHYLNIMRDFFSDDESPALKLADELNLPIFAMTHSTGGLLFTDLMLNDDAFAHKVSSHFTGGVHISPFFDASNASKKYDPIKRGFFKFHSRRNWREAYGDTLAEFGYALIQKFMFRNESISDFKFAPRFCDIWELINQAQDKVISKVENSMRFILLAQYFISSPKDAVSCFKTADYVGGKIPVKIKEARGFHNPLDGNEPLLDQLVEAMMELATFHDVLARERAERMHNVNDRFSGLKSLLNFGRKSPSPN